MIKAYSTDEWQFEISGDVGNLQDYKTAKSGIHLVPTTMNIDKYDFLQVYDLKPFSSCRYRAIEGGECDSNKEYMLENCATMCNLLPLVSCLLLV